jgi:acetylornithine/N-succinyldiaminopimelate aminotransferase
MNTTETIEQFKKYVIANYGRVESVIVKGSGSTITDADGKEYLDMFPGWAVSGIGHCHPKVVRAIQEQAEKLIHIDNTFYSEKQGELAELLSERGFGGQSFFCNSGTEAVEAALKLARRQTSKEKYKFITAQGGFHGRTFAAVTATAQPKYHQGFLPLVPGFVYVPYNDIDALREAFDDEVAAVMIEPIQGEGGIQIASNEYLQTIRELCDAHGALAIWDEVQCGMGRTGKWFAHQHSGIEPDIMTMAKSLGGGVAIGAIMAKEEVAASLVPGTHASTFGGNPLACAAAVATIEAIDEEHLLANAEKMGQYTRGKLEALKTRHHCIEKIRGVGLMIGLELNEPGAGIVQACWDKGLRINCTQESILRLMPAMTVTEELIDRALGILDEVLSTVNCKAGG